MYRIALISLIGACACIGFANPSTAAAADRNDPDALDHSNVVWNSPSRDFAGSMPIGNGDIGLNVWVEKGGDVLFYIGKTDSFSEDGRILKLGRVRVTLWPNLLAENLRFRQELRLRQGEILIAAGPAGREKTLRVWVDANNPVIRVEADGAEPFEMQASLEVWRTTPHELKTAAEKSSARELEGWSKPLMVQPDIIVPARNDRLRWYHRNETSTYPIVFENQHLGGLLGKFPDPLLHRTFGGCIKGQGLTATDSQTLKSAQPAKRFVVSIYPLTARSATAAEWLKRLDAQVDRIDAQKLEAARTAHRRWWGAFWSRSWIHVTGSADAETVTRGYTLTRWLMACGGRGNIPTKFNGSIFTVDTEIKGEKLDADYRAWGGNFWFQNTRLIYWPMLAAGDYDMQDPWFRMYVDALPLALARTKLYYGHAGAFFPETMYFWGTYANKDFGWGNPQKDAVNTYIRYYWSGGLELVTMLLDRYDQTLDKEFARRTLMPLADAITAFFDQHWKRDADGKIRFDPAESLETWHVAVNPLPEIAGLGYVLPRLIALSQDLATPAQKARWRKTLADLPPIPMREENGGRVLAAGESYSQRKNHEDPQLYAIFPYRLYGLGHPDLEMAVRTYNTRMEQKCKGCWHQHGIFAAYLGLAEEARSQSMVHFTFLDGTQRFPAFWKPGHDWVPDMDNGGVGMTTLQRMLMQAEGNTIRLLPAWPKDWSAAFKLNAPFRTTVEGKVSDGKLVNFKVTPAERRKDVVIGNE